MCHVYYKHTNYKNSNFCQHSWTFKKNPQEGRLWWVVRTLTICVKKKKKNVKDGVQSQHTSCSLCVVCVFKPRLQMRSPHFERKKNTHTHTVKVPSYQRAAGTFVVAETSVLLRWPSLPVSKIYAYGTHAGTKHLFSYDEHMHWVPTVAPPPSRGPTHCKDNVSPDLFALLLSPLTLPSPQRLTKGKRLHSSYFPVFMCSCSTKTPGASTVRLWDRASSSRRSSPWPRPLRFLHSALH